MKTIKLTSYSVAIALGIAFFVGCAKDEPEAIVLPPIGGFNSANEVGAADLLAYWPLEGNGIESKSSTAPNATVGASYEAGAKGQGLKLANGYLKYPSIGALSTSLTSFSISTWAKVKNNGTSASVFLSLTRPNEWAGNINFLAETGWKPATIDSLAVKGLIVSDNTIGWQDSRNTTKLDQGMITENAANPTAIQHAAFPNIVGGQWAQSVITWDATTRLFKVYSNGVKISNPKWEERGAPNGMMLNFYTPTTPIIGAFGDIATTIEPWNKAMTGSLDEIRIWKKALNAADVKSLFELEKAGR